MKHANPSVLCAQVSPFLAVPVANTRTRTSLDSLVNCPAIRDYRPWGRPDIPHWIVTLSPISMHLDAEVGELLKPFEVHKMSRVSAKEVNFTVSSKKIAILFRALNGVLVVGHHNLEVTVRKAVSAKRVEPAVGGLQVHQPMVAKDSTKSSMLQFRSDEMPQEASAEEMAASAKPWMSQFRFQGMPQKEDTSTEEMAVSKKSSISQFHSEGMPQEETSEMAKSLLWQLLSEGMGRR